VTRNDDNCLDDLRISKNNKILKNKINSISISSNLIISFQNKNFILKFYSFINEGVIAERRVLFNHIA